MIKNILRLIGISDTEKLNTGGNIVIQIDINNFIYNDNSEGQISIKGAKEMDMGEIANATVALVAPYAAEGGKEFSKKVGAAAFAKIEQLFAMTKKNLVGAAAKEALVDLQEKPNDPKRQAALEVQLEKAFAADPDFAEELQTALQEIEKKSGKPIGDIINVAGNCNTTFITKGSGNIIKG